MKYQRIEGLVSFVISNYNNENYIIRLLRFYIKSNL